ncbi:YihY/virulence factor BrkB family protein [Temperatibacter marinus]|uniref:YihY/virulence factor BrkB family protein n=1 Tax=Temperatibacter marinus TaxID=1456591 RepID=A0AA52H8K7_9PROT|nr:YihY/virulence factor BrkB family protein [Temperatibacter marinus]WND01944.1 YihY/virulence factor BrkB family protein [Temperatibacter marinus]
MTEFSSTYIYSKTRMALRILGDAGRGFGHNHGMAAAGNMAFLAMFCLFPFLIFMISISGVVGQSDQGLEAIEFILSLLPPEVSQTLNTPIQGILRNAGKEILTFSILFALLTAANGIEAGREIVIRAFGREYGHSFWKRRLESLAFVIISSFLILLSMSVQVMGPPIIKAINSLFPDIMTGGLQTFWTWLTFAISPLFLLIGLYVLYVALTPRSIYRPFRLPGAILTLALFLLTAKGLSAYLKSVGTYDVTYGSLAGVVIVQLFCYVVSIGFIFGAEFNAAWTKHSDRVTQSEKEETEKPSQKSESLS